MHFAWGQSLENPAKKVHLTDEFEGPGPWLGSGLDGGGSRQRSHKLCRLPQALMRRAGATAAVCIVSLGALLLPLGMPRPTAAAAAQRACWHAWPSGKGSTRARDGALRALRGGADEANGMGFSQAGGVLLGTLV